MRVKCLAQEHNAVPQPGLEPGLFRDMLLLYFFDMNIFDKTGSGSSVAFSYLPVQISRRLPNITRKLNRNDEEFRRLYELKILSFLFFFSFFLAKMPAEILKTQDAAQFFYVHRV